jgi:hypothetical protein
MKWQFLMFDECRDSSRKRQFTDCCTHNARHLCPGDASYSYLVMVLQLLLTALESRSCFCKARGRAAYRTDRCGAPSEEKSLKDSNRGPFSPGGKANNTFRATIAHPLRIGRFQNAPLARCHAAANSAYYASDRFHPDRFITPPSLRRSRGSRHIAGEVNQTKESPSIKAFFNECAYRQGAQSPELGSRREVLRIGLTGFLWILFGFSLLT